MDPSRAITDRLIGVPPSLSRAQGAPEYRLADQDEAVVRRDAHRPDFTGMTDLNCERVWLISINQIAPLPGKRE
jgi:hypothetical protein